MQERFCDVAVIGAGPAGLAAAVSAKKNGAGQVLVVERDALAGGILQQCIHAGFGLRYFGEELTGPEYAERFKNSAGEQGVELLMNTTATEIRDKLLVCANASGLVHIHYKALVLAMGCRERTRANIVIPGSRPAGLYTAGTAQKLINIYGKSIGREVVILGSGDIGMVMARRMTIQGAKVKAVVEIMPYLAGLMRNKIQCLDDYGIPLLMSHTVTDISGVDRVESVTIAPVDENRRPIYEKSQVIPCDTLLISVGLIPENELSSNYGVSLSTVTNGANVNQFNQTSIKSVFSCGNVLYVKDLVDNVSAESEATGKYAAMYARGEIETKAAFQVNAGKNIAFVSPQELALGIENDAVLNFRVSQPFENVRFTAKCANTILCSKTVHNVGTGATQQLKLTKQMISEVNAPVSVEAEALEEKK